MELSQWSKIQANWIFLLENVNVTGILPYLYQSKTINEDDEERIKAETTSRDQCTRLLRIVKRKHNSYEDFRNALQKIGQKFIIQKLRETNSDLAPIAEDDKINAALIENFAESSGSQVSSADVQSAIAKCIQRELDEDEVFKCVSLCFGSDVSLHVEEGENGSRYFTNLRRKTTSPTCDKVEADIEKGSKEESSKGRHMGHCNSKQSQRKKLERMGIEELIKALEPKIKERDILNPKITETFRQHKVTGEVYLYMDLEEIRIEFPDLTYGERKTLLIIRDELKKEDESFCGDDELLLESVKNNEDEDLRQEEDLPRRVECLRKFDTTLKAIDCYRQGSEVITHVTRCHNMIEPIRDFRHDPAKGPDELLDWIQEQVIRFSAACLNDRTNGTLFFGILKLEDHAEVVGLSVDREIISKGISQAIKECFYPDQYEIAMKCIREPQFVNVLYKNSKSPLYVIEVDVVPNSKLTQEEAFFVTLKCFGQSEMVLLRWHETIVEKIENKEWREFMLQKNRLKQLREEREKSASQVKQISEDLRTKFEGLLFPGSDMSDDLYRMLLLSPLDSSMDQNFIQENLDFVNSLDPHIIFDFSPETNSDGGSIYRYMEEEKQKVLKALTTDDFDKNGKENKEKPDRLPNLHDYIRSTSLKQWIFCNGYGPLNKLPLDLLNWKQQRSEGFKDTLRFYKDEIPEDRVIAIFCLFSKNYDVMLEAAEEVLIKFQHQWMVLAPDETIAENWIAELLRRQSVDKETIKARSVIGMPWNHISQTVSQLIGSSDETSVELPTSTGAFCRLKEKVKNELFDLDILGRNECQNNDIIKDQQKLRELKAKVEEHFFRGGLVQWWNFWFSGLVLKRHIHDRLMKLVKETLDGSIDEEDKVGIIHLYHQPGAGGSTTARQILWDLKSEYRCCVLKSITDETCEQISAFRRYEAEDPRPTVILIDNLEEDKVNHLYIELEEKARVEYRNSEKPFKVFCILLLCQRKTSLSTKDFKVKDRNCVMLHHELAENEIAWFHEKNRYLEEKHKLQNGVDPKLLISFNIMKENFNPEYIQNSVRAFCDDITKPNERQLLKFVSVMNTFDLDFQPLPVSAFDVIMNEEVLVSYGLVVPGRLRTGKSWESCISAALKVLLNRASRAGLGKQIQGLCIVNHLFAKEIMNYILKSEKKGVSDVMKELLISPIVRGRNMTQTRVVKIVKDVLKKRDSLENGTPEKFSPIVMFIEKEEGQDKAAEVLERGFEMTNDPMIAQQLSRLFIHCKNWEKAKKYAEEATKLKPQSSFLWDTFGQVYKSQVYDCIKHCVQTGEKLGQEDATRMVKIALEAIDKFKEEQKISEQEKITSQNNSGFVAELRATNMLLDLFIQFSFYPGETKVHKFLIDRKYIPPEFKHFGDEILARLKTLHSAVDDTMRNLEEKQNHVKDETVDVYRRREQYLFRDQVINLRENLDNYFGEHNDEIPHQLVSVDDQNAYRTRRMKRLGGRSLSALLRLPKVVDDSQKLARLKSIMALAEKNVWTLRGKDIDYVIYIGAIIAMKSLKLKSPPLNVEFEYNHLLHLSEKLFSIGVHDRAYLETFLYLVMLHWPTDNRKGFKLCPIPKLIDAIKKWKDAFYRKHPRQQPDGSIYHCHRKKDTTYFFLCKGVGLDEILYYEELHRGDKFIRGDAVWRTPIAKERLQRLTGTLTSEGTEVLVPVTSATGNQSTISIPTSLPIGQRGLWHKRVYFVLGFGWSGPKAYNVTQHDPSSNGGGDTKVQSRGANVLGNIVSTHKHSNGSDKDSDEDDFEDSAITSQVFRRQASKASAPQRAPSSLQIFQELQAINKEISELEKSPSKENRTRLDELKKRRKELVSDKNVKQLYMDYN